MMWPAVSRVSLFEAVVIVLACIGGCNASNSGSGSGSQESTVQAASSDALAETYFQASEGTRWKWRLTTTIGDGKGPLKPTVFTDSSESRIAGKEDIDGVMCFRIEKSDQFGNVVQTEWIAVRPDGHFRYRIDKDRFDPPPRILALPAKVGTKWKGTYSFRGVPISTSSRIEAEEAITVAAGTFQTIRVKVDAGLLTTTTWYAPGVGVVKQLVDKSIQLQKDEMELEEFTKGDTRAVPQP
jgi:hypothetical protein